jgi:hypothetical protein
MTHRCSLTAGAAYGVLAAAAASSSAPAMAASLTSEAWLTQSAAPLKFQNAMVERNHGETENKRIV